MLPNAVWLQGWCTKGIISITGTAAYHYQEKWLYMEEMTVDRPVAGWTEYTQQYVPDQPPQVSPTISREIDLAWDCCPFPQRTELRMLLENERVIPLVPP